MSEPSEDDHLFVSDNQVLEWRVDQLERAGYSYVASLELGIRADIDLHDAAKLLADGCDEKVALRVLL